MGVAVSQVPFRTLLPCMLLLLWVQMHSLIFKKHPVTLRLPKLVAQASAAAAMDLGAEVQQAGALRVLPP